MTLLERFKASSFRGPGFDQIRLGAAIIVLFHHCSGVNGNDVRLDPLFHFSYGYIHFGFLAVAIFFAISGFLVTPSLLRSGNIIDFATRRILRIFPGLICVVFVTMLVLGPVLTILPLAEYFTDFQFYRYAKNIVTLTVDHLPGVTSGDGHPIDVNGSLWTLHFEVLSYAALAITSILGILHRRSLFLALFLISYGTNIVLGLDPAFSALLPARFVTFMSLFVYFMTGAMLVCVCRPHSVFADTRNWHTRPRGGDNAFRIRRPFCAGLLILPDGVSRTFCVAGTFLFKARLILRRLLNSRARHRGDYGLFPRLSSMVARCGDGTFCDFGVCISVLDVCRRASNEP